MLSGWAMSQTPLTQPAYLRPFPHYGTIVCTEHRLGYTPQNVIEHLVHAHKAKGEQKKATEEWLKQTHFNETVEEPASASAPIPGLEVFTGWQCRLCQPAVLSRSRQAIERHCSKEHRLNSKQMREDRNAVEQVSVQKWFAKSNKYWIVNLSNLSETSPTSPVSPTASTTPFPSSPVTLRRSSVASRVSTLTSAPSILHQLSQSIALEDATHRKQLSQVEHTAELSPWLRLCRYHEHLVDIEPNLIASSYLVPRKVEDHPELFYISESVTRVLEYAYNLVDTLHHVDAKRLNSFQAGLVSQDPFARLQERRSFLRYSVTFTRLMCYFYRVAHDDHFQQSMFQLTPMQESAFRHVSQAVQSLRTYITSQSHESNSSHSSEDEDEEDAEQRQLEVEVDKWVLSLFVALIQHRTTESGFHSAVMSFCAVISWNSTTGTWLGENQSASLLSQLVYCCQLIILAESHRLSLEGQYEDRASALEKLCSQWLWNTSKGPVSDMLRLRLYAMKVASTTVHAAQIRWRSDGETLVYRDLTYRISDLSTELNCYLEHAKLIFHRDLCFNIENVPTFRLTELEDNWDARHAGNSFLTDVRNASQFGGCDQWLIDHLAARPELYELVVQCSDDSDQMDDQVKSSFAQEYEASIQRFLMYMFLLMHKFSGQSARLEEMLSLLWQNKAITVRNLYLHDGYLLFLLTYHKALHRTHASRFPVRFLFPDVGQLMVQYLVLILPMRRLLSKAVGIPLTVSEYLWHDGSKLWSAKKITDFAKAASQSAIGVAVNIQAWRQITVAIAVKKFGGLDYQADLDLAGDADDDVGGQSILDSWGGAMANVFHLQAAHSTNTGNRIYGGTINFEGGLTDAGLQEYFRASRLWHQLCRPQVLTSQAGQRRTASSRLSQSINMPLTKRLAIRDQPARHRIRWGSDQIHFAMRQLFPHTSTVSFRSPHQEALIEAIVSGCSEVVGVLATGEGKSWAFLLPACLPRAAMTVVVVPLIALKSDLVRRCTDAGLHFAVWDPRQTSHHQYFGTPLLFVSVDQAVRGHFRSFLGQLDAMESLDRVVFDEAHLILTASPYRPKMTLVRQLRSLFCPVVFLTATLPPMMQAQFEARMLLKQPRVIRSSTFRRDIVLRLRRSSDGNLLSYICKMATSLLEAYHTDPAARFIIYTCTRADADSVSDQLQCPKYYSDSGDVDEKQEAMQQWRSGQHKVMVATSAFGVGIDFPSVRQVIHMGVPTDMIGFAQEIGRLSRDGQGGFSRVILPKGWQSSNLPSLRDQRRSAVSTLAMSVYLHQNRCLSAVLSRFLDGVSGIQYCQASDASFRCSKCTQFGLFDAQQEQDHTSWWDSTAKGEEEDEDDTDDANDANGADEEAVRSYGMDTTTAEHQLELDLGDQQVEEYIQRAERESGSERLRVSNRDVSMQRGRFEELLHAFRGRCMICMLLGRGQIPVAQQWHPLHQCAHIQRRQFLQAKSRAIARNRHRGGWLEPYVACFFCGLPQEMCEVRGDEGGRTCRYRDLVFPAGWALWHCESGRWGRSLGQISGAVGGVVENEERWMDWLGSTMDVGEWWIRGCQAVRMLDFVLSFTTGEMETA